VIVARTAELAEDHLSAGTMYCPRCGGPLTRWGFGRPRTIRSHGRTTVELRPRRVRYTDCLDTHIVLPAAFQARRADTTEVIGQALLLQANGLGHRRIAALMGRAESTVRRWLGRATPTHLNWIYQQGVQRLVQIAPDALADQKFTGNLVRDSLSVLGAAAFWDRRRFGFTDAAWTLIGSYTFGRLLAPPR
jgi:hypothetical protein